MNKLITAILRLFKPSKNHDCAMYHVHCKDIDTAAKNITTWIECAVCAERID